MTGLSSQSIEFLQLLLDTFIKSAVILLAAGLLAVSLRRASAASRHLVWSVALASLLALPILSVALPVWRISALPSLATAISVDEGVRESAGLGTSDVSADYEYKREIVVATLDRRQVLDSGSGLSAASPVPSQLVVAPNSVAPSRSFD